MHVSHSAVCAALVASLVAATVTAADDHDDHDHPTHMPGERYADQPAAFAPHTYAPRATKHMGGKQYAKLGADPVVKVYSCNDACTGCVKQAKTIIPLTNSYKTAWCVEPTNEVGNVWSEFAQQRKCDGDTSDVYQFVQYAAGSNCTLDKQVGTFFSNNLQPNGEITDCNVGKNGKSSFKISTDGKLEEWQGAQNCPTPVDGVNKTISNYKAGMCINDRMWVGKVREAPQGPRVIGATGDPKTSDYDWTDITFPKIAVQLYGRDANVQGQFTRACPKTLKDRNTAAVESTLAELPKKTTGDPETSDTKYILANFCYGAQGNKTMYVCPTSTVPPYTDASTVPNATSSASAVSAVTAAFVAVACIFA